MTHNKKAAFEANFIPDSHYLVAKLEVTDAVQTKTVLCHCI